MLNRSVPPAFSRNFNFELPKPDVIQAGYTPLILLSGVQQEVFKFDVVVKAGKWYETKSGLAHFTSTLLNKGTKHKNSKEIAEVLDYFGSQIEIASGYDFTTISLYGLKRNIEDILPLFIEILTEPIFPEEEFDLQKQIFLQNLEINEKKNSFVASKKIRKNIFGAGHPYGNSTEQEDVAALSTADLKDYFRSSFSPYEVYGVGNFDPGQVTWCAGQLSALNGGGAGGVKENSIQPGMQTEYAARPDSVQSTIRLGKITINRDHADYFPLLLLNHILGGYFGSRLMKNVREKKGLTYGIYSSLSPFRNSCLLSIGADVNKSNLQLTVDEIKKELSVLVNEAISESELDVAKNHFLGSLQLEVANPFAALDKVKGIRLNQLDDQYYNNLFGEIQATTPAGLKHIAGKYLDLKSWTEVSVG